MTVHVISLGDLVVDLIAPVTLPILPFQHQEARGVTPEPGGSGNFMIAGVRMGMKVSSIGAVGDDLFGQFLLNVLRSEGVNTAGITVVPGSRSTLVLDLVDAATQQHTFIGSPAVGDPVPYTDTVEQLLTSAGALFLQGYTLHERQIADLVPQVLARARALGLPVYFDVGPTVRHLPFERVQHTMRQSDILMMTEDELPLAADGRTGAAAYAFLLSLGARLLVIKQGAQGCLLVQPQQQEQVPGFPVPVVDTIGAGDCFDAAFIYGQQRGFSLRDSARLANAMGAASVQKSGSGRNAPTCAELLAVLRQFKVEVDFSC
ncbi:MAG: carbohydrate kinase family protein [Anaerolineae bacterium]|nr:carbohydrate kinase family protein [Anaerolineae bacterium]